MHNLWTHRFRPQLSAGAVLFILGTAVLSMSAAEWPAYRGPTSDGHTSEKIQTSWPEDGPRVLWKLKSSGGFSSFAVGNGRAYCLELRSVEGADQEVLVAREARTGSELWTQPLGVFQTRGGGDDGARGNQGGDGPRSTPTLDGDKVYTLSLKLVLQCFDAETGKEIWKRDLMREHSGREITWGNAASPVIEGDLVLVAGGGVGQSLIGFDKSSGAPQWKSFDETITHATPVIAEIHGKRQAIFFLQSGLLSVDPATGIELWRYKFPFNISTAASPVVAGDIVYCSAGYNVGAGAARIVRNGDIWTATEIYRVRGNKLANHWSTPVLIGDHLYGMFQFKEYGDGPVKCVEVATGSVKWETPGFGPGNVIAVGGKVLALSDAGSLILIDPSAEAYRELARAEVLKGKCWTTPVVAGGHIFARSTEEAVCLEVVPQSASR